VNERVRGDGILIIISMDVRKLFAVVEIFVAVVVAVGLVVVVRKKN